MLRLLNTISCLGVLLLVTHPVWCADHQNSPANQGKIDSLHYRLEIPGSPADKIRALTELCIIYLRQEPDKSAGYGEQALEMGHQYQIEPEPDLLRYLANAYER
ncbi:MAG: hypothetical protein MIO92_11755, partial [Methanosarcinaceae archaeon]|nr:hypothetical protein [Methanosarcinaceae archaeon]